jgi:hypothetical protein
MSSSKVYGPVGEIRPFLDHSITTHYMTAIPDQGGKIIAGANGSWADTLLKLNSV